MSKGSLTQDIAVNVPNPATLDYMLLFNLQIKLLLHFRESFFLINNNKMFTFGLLCCVPLSFPSKRHCYVAQNLSVLQFCELLSDALISPVFVCVCFDYLRSCLCFWIIVQSSISLGLQPSLLHSALLKVIFEFLFYS